MKEQMGMPRPAPQEAADHRSDVVASKYNELVQQMKDNADRAANRAASTTNTKRGDAWMEVVEAWEEAGQAYVNVHQGYFIKGLAEDSNEFRALDEAAKKAEETARAAQDALELLS